MKASQNRIKIYNSGESAIYCSLGDKISPSVNFRVNAFEKYIINLDVPGITETVPSYSGLMIYYNPLLLERGSLITAVNKFPAIVTMEPGEAGTGSTAGIIIPVCYGGDLGPDLQYVAEHASLSAEKVIEIHTSSSYLVYMLGFTPGFPYLGGMDEQISTPRKDEPALSIAAGSVGIAGDQTGIYPVASPGGWQIIGRSPVKLFNPASKSPFLIEPGMYIRFKAISRDEFIRVVEEVDAGRYLTDTETVN